MAYGHEDEDDRLKGLARGNREGMAVSNDVARSLAVIKQGLGVRPRSHDADSMLEAVRRIKLLQLDTINVVDRSHYLVMLSRMGPYDKADLDSLSYPGTKLVEQRSHEACLMPVESYPILNPEFTRRRNLPISNIKLKQLGPNPDRVLDGVLGAVKENGPLSSKDFTDKRKGERNGWWDRKPERVALEILWKRGYLSVQRRGNFQCYYDLPERVIPERYLRSSASMDDFVRWTITNSLDAQGIATAADVNDYFRQNIRDTREMLERMVDEGSVTRVSVEGWGNEAYALTRDVETINELNDRIPRFETSTLLSPFDNLIWYRDRMERVFGVHFRIEMYTPKSDREGGYYSMPLLHRGRIIGVADPKADRENGRMLVHSIRLYDGVRADDDIVHGISKAVKELASFTGCDAVEIGKTSPKGLLDSLETSMEKAATKRSRLRS